MIDLNYLYEEVLEEGAILDWMKHEKNRPVLKKLVNELGSMGIILTSPLAMAGYVNGFLEQNFPNLSSDIIGKITQYLASNPQVLEMFK